jgi:MtN3 and saliva related transmembrane protein
VNIQLVGLFAGLCTTAAWVPQLVRTWTRGSTEDLSWPYLLVFATGVSSWIAYGVLTQDVPVIAANIISILLIGLLVQLKHGTRRRQAVEPPADAGSVPGAIELGAVELGAPRTD